MNYFLKFLSQKICFNKFRKLKKHRKFKILRETNKIEDNEFNKNDLNETISNKKIEMQALI